MTKGSFCVRLDVQTWRRVTLLALLTLLPFTALPERAGVGAARVVHAQTPTVYVVNTTADTFGERGLCLDLAGNCSLRAAIQAANAHDGSDTIRFRFETSCGTACLINLNSPLPDITQSLTITGPGPDDLIIRRNKLNDSTTLSDYYRIFTIRGNITVSLSGMSILNGYAKVLNPHSSTEGDESSGGGVLVRDATVTITNCRIESNAAEFRGGGITNYAGTLTVIESTIINNSTGPSFIGEPTGGGIYTSNALTVRRSAILGNDTYSRGGGITAFGPEATAVVENTTIAGNRATHAGNGSGGGILNASAEVSVRNSTIVLNEAKYAGGGISEGLDNQPILHLPLTHVKSSIVALNIVTSLAADSGPDVGGASIFSDGFNLIGVKDGLADGFNKPTDKTGTVASPLDPQLDTFGFHGGQTRNYSLKLTSPALDAGISNGLTTDQRGTGFRRTSDDEAIVNATGGDGTDIGSFEVEVPDTVPPTINCTVTGQTLWYATDVSVSCTATDTDSGLANAADASFTLSTAVSAGTETSSAMTTTRSVCDNEGNCATAGAYAFKVDKKGPVLACVAATYLLNAANARVSATVTDGGSGAAVTPVTVAANTSSVGAKTAMVTGTDLVGNSTTVSCPYQINYAFSGFLSPIKNPPLVNTGNAGRGFVLSWQLQDANGTFISALSAFTRVRAVSTPCTIPSGAVQPNGGSGPKGTVHYDTTTHTYGYNWLSPRTPGCYEVRVEVDSGQAFSALFQLF